MGAGVSWRISMCPGLLCTVSLTKNPSLQSISSVYFMQLDAVIGTLKDRLETMQKDAAEWKAKYNLKTQEEVQALQRQQMAAS